MSEWKWLHNECVLSSEKRQTQSNIQMWQNSEAICNHLLYSDSIFFIIRLILDTLYFPEHNPTEDQDRLNHRKACHKTSEVSFKLNQLDPYSAWPQGLEYMEYLYQL